MSKTPADRTAETIGLGEPLGDAATTEAVQAPGQKAATKRLTANLPLDAARDLAETAEATGFNKLTTLVRAIRVFAELVKVDQAGGEVIIKEPDGSRARLLLR